MLPEEEQSLRRKERREMRREERRTTNESSRKSKSFRRIILWVAATLAIGGASAGIWYVMANQSDEPVNTDESALSNQVSSADWMRGNTSSKIILVEYADFQCPACAQYHPIIKKLE